jgi:uncharacterized membrane protein YeaQ/YmgE (transglycosylase-associated protein family)
MEWLGPGCFGLVVGWVCYRTLRRKTDGAGLGDIAGVIGAIGGTTVVAIFKNDAFNIYCVGLAIGFFAYFIVGVIIDKSNKTSATAGVGTWMKVNREEL